MTLSVGQVMWLKHEVPVTVLSKGFGATSSNTVQCQLVRSSVIKFRLCLKCRGCSKLSN
jgi:hypothetical protein